MSDRQLLKIGAWFYVLTVVLLVLALQYSTQGAKADHPIIWERITHGGLDCAVLYTIDSTGMSCNWEQYNKDMNKLKD